MNLLQGRIEMCDFRIIRHDDYHGDAMLFSVVDEDGHELRRVPSEAEAIEWALYLEAWVENEERDAYLEAWAKKRRARRGGVIIEGRCSQMGGAFFVSILGADRDGKPSEARRKAKEKSRWT